MSELRDPISSFTSYKAYVDSLVSEADRAYLEDPETQRALVELGFRGMGDTLKREEFDARKQSDRERHLHKELAPKSLAGVGKSLMGKPLLQALAAREELVRNGKLSTIIFIRDKNARGQEVSGYIDFGHRLKTDSWDPIFEGRVKLLPRPSDLSFYNWDTATATCNASPNFAVITESDEKGLLFKAKRDRKVRWSAGRQTARRLFHAAPPSPQVINVDPNSNPGDNSSRTEIPTGEHLQAVLFDHFLRRQG
jgi:Domain of unknown function (DUF4464)